MCIVRRDGPYWRADEEDGSALGVAGAESKRRRSCNRRGITASIDPLRASAVTVRAARADTSIAPLAETDNPEALLAKRSTG